MRFIFDRRLRTLDQMDTLTVYNDAFKSKTILVCGDETDVPKAFESQGIRVWKLPLSSEAFWRGFREQCREESIHGVYFEGGPSLLSELLANQELNYLFAYRAPKFLADSDAPAFMEGQSVDQMSDAYSLEKVQHGTFGDDQLTRGFINYSKL
jgi:riboflavin biosynthesis pyrimidine reductase